MRGKVPLVPPMSITGIENAAFAFLRRFYPDLLTTPRPFPAQRFFEADVARFFGYQYGVEALMFGYEAVMNPVSKDLIVSEETYLRLDQGEGRARFTIAHEAGHIYLHARFFQEAHYEGKNSPKFNRGEIPSYRDPEWQANNFAPAILMPKNHMIDLVQKGAQMEDVSRIFGVSHTAASIRIEKVRKIFGQQ